MINNKLFRGFTFDGVNSLDYDIYITGAGVYNAPERAVEKVSVPGRNGDLTIDQGRFENIEVTYAECGCAATTQEEFAEKVQAFRNALCSRVGYKRLTDDYNKDEYRMAMYVSGLEVEAIAQHRMGTFDIVFDAKPQRFLYTGETPRLLVQGMTPKNLQTESGAIVSVESDGDAVTSLVAQIEPVQSGSGAPSPTNVRPITGWTAANVNVAGKNLAKVTEGSTTSNGVTFVKSAQGFVTANGTANPSFGFVNLDYKANTLMVPKEIPLIISGGAENVGVRICWDRGGGTTENSPISYGDDVRYTIPEEARTSWLRIVTPKGGTANATVYPMLRLDTETDATYEPYKGHTVTVSFGSVGTIYGGSINPVTGELKSTHAIATYGVGTWSPTPSSIATVGNLTRFWLYVGSGKAWGDASVICDRLQSISNNNYYSTTQGIGSGAADSATSIWVKLPTADVGTTADSIKAWLLDNPITIVYPLTTPKTYNLTAQQVELLTGQNHVWADTGDITITWGDDPYKVVNPTLFESKPLLMVTGHGTLSVGDVTMTITGTASQVLYIDCDIMEVYSITGGQMQPQNSLVTMNSYDFPKLKPGANKITLGVGITQVVVTPRWWRV